MKEGQLHLYIGEGKGKTTAAVGLAVRAAGWGKHVVFVQFLKGQHTGELPSLKKLGVRIVRSEKDFGFIHEMDDGQVETFRAEQIRLFCELKQFAAPPSEALGFVPADMLVLDEALDAISAGLLDEEELKIFVAENLSRMELVFTGRDAPGWLKEKAGYITEMRKIRHPYDNGQEARQAVEY